MENTIKIEIENNIIKIDIGYEENTNKSIINLVNSTDRIKETINSSDFSALNNTGHEITTEDSTYKENIEQKQEEETEAVLDIKSEIERIKRLAKEMTSDIEKSSKPKERLKRNIPKDIENSDKKEESKEIFKPQLIVCGKALDRTEQELIEAILKKELDDLVSAISFEKNKEDLGLLNISKTYYTDLDVSETKFIKGSLRSGLRTEFMGSVVVLGDLNYGAEVIASGNVIVLGTLRGIAHAGANGNKLAFISANATASTQIRIANEVKEITEHDKFPVFHIENYNIVVDQKRRKAYGKSEEQD